MEATSFSESTSITSPAPSYRSTASDVSQFPHWSRAVAASLQSRQPASRASSIISTRTQLSTNTTREDARSIDLNIDGTHFKISRDGSSITTTDLCATLPQYPQFGRLNGVPHDLAGNILSPNEQHNTPASSQRVEQIADCERNLLPQDLLQRCSCDTYNTASMAEADDDLPRPLALLPGEEAMPSKKSRALSPYDSRTPLPIRRKPLNTNSRLGRRNAVRLPKLSTNVETSYQPQSCGVIRLDLDSASSPGRLYPHSADPMLETNHHSHLSRHPSRAYMGKAATGLFPSQSMTSIRSPTYSLADDQNTVIAHSPIDGEQGSTMTSFPIPMDMEKDICAHYSGLLRAIDRNHREVLQGRDKEMARLRERIDVQDIIYRQQLRARDFIIEDLRSRLNHLESRTEAAVEKASNAVEGLWERRLKDRDHHLTERIRRMEADQRLAIEQAVKEKDRFWSEAWSTKHEQFIQRIEDVVQLSRAEIPPFRP